MEEEEEEEEEEAICGRPYRDVVGGGARRGAAQHRGGHQQRALLAHTVPVYQCTLAARRRRHPPRWKRDQGCLWFTSSPQSPVPPHALPPRLGRACQAGLSQPARERGGGRRARQWPSGAETPCVGPSVCPAPRRVPHPAPPKQFRSRIHVSQSAAECGCGGDGTQATDQ